VSRTNAQLWSAVGSGEELLPNGCTLIHGAAVAGRLRAGRGATLHVARRGLQFVHSLAHSSAASLVVLDQLLVPVSELQSESACCLGSFSDDQCPCPSDLVVCVVLVSLVLVGVPIGESVDHVCDGVEVCEGEAGLGFLWWEIVWCVVAESLNELEQVVAHTVVCVVGCWAVAKRESLAEVLFVFFKDGEGRLDRGSGRLCHNGLPDVGTLIADVLDQVAELIRREGLEEAWKRQRTAYRCVCAGALDGAVLVREAAVLQRWRRRGGHALVVQLLIGLSLPAGHVLLLVGVCHMDVSSVHGRRVVNVGVGVGVKVCVGGELCCGLD
jgi:hypothetical protein